MIHVIPNDENGLILRRMQENGDDLTKARDIDFTVQLPGEGPADRFAEHFRQLGYRVSVEETKTVPELPWDVVVVRHAIPTHHEISEFEETLSAFATPLGGRNDGWGSFAQPVHH